MTLAFETAAAHGRSPVLQWCKTRLQHLLDTNETQAAIKLSVKSNLVCPLTAFIAWDEAEKVAVATHDLAQPNLAMAGALADCAPCGLRISTNSPVPIRRSPKTPLFGSASRDLHDDPLETDESDVQIMERRAALEAALLDLCNRSGNQDWDRLCRRILDTVFCLPKPDRPSELAELEQAVSYLIEKFARQEAELLGDNELPPVLMERRRHLMKDERRFFMGRQLGRLVERWLQPSCLLPPDVVASLKEARSKFADAL